MFFKESLEICSKQHKTTTTTTTVVVVVVAAAAAAAATIIATTGCVKISRPTLTRYNFDKCGRIFIIFTIIFVRDL